MDGDKNKMSFQQCNSRHSMDYSLHNLKILCGHLANVAAKMNLMLEYHQSECTNPNSLALLVMQTSVYVNDLVNSLESTTNHCESELEDLFPGKDLLSFERLIKKRECANLTRSTTLPVPPSSNGSEQGHDIEGASSQGQSSSDLSNEEQKRSEEPVQDNFPVEVPVPAAAETAEDEAAGTESSETRKALDADIDSESSLGQGSSDSDQQQDPSEEPVEDNFPVEIPVPAETVEDEASQTESSVSLSESVFLALEYFGDEIDNDAASSTLATSRKRKMPEDPDYAPQTRRRRRTVLPPIDTSTSPQYSARKSRRRILKELPYMSLSDQPLRKKTSEKRNVNPTADCGGQIIPSEANQAPLLKNLSVSLCRLSDKELESYKLSSEANKCDKQVKIVVEKLTAEDIQKWCVSGVPPASKSFDFQETDPSFHYLSCVPSPPLFEQIAAELSQGQTPAAPLAEPSASTRIPEGSIDTDKEGDTPGEVYQLDIDIETQPLHSEMSPPHDNANDKMDCQNGYENDRLNGRPTLVLVLLNEISPTDDNVNVILPPQGPQLISYAPATIDDNVDTNNDLEIQLIPKRPHCEKTKYKDPEIDNLENNRKMFPCDFCESQYAHIRYIYEHSTRCNKNPLNKYEEHEETSEYTQMVDEIVNSVIAGSRKIPDAPADSSKKKETKLDRLDGDVQTPTTDRLQTDRQSGYSEVPPTIQKESSAQLRNKQATRIGTSKETVKRRSHRSTSGHIILMKQKGKYAETNVKHERDTSCPLGLSCSCGFKGARLSYLIEHLNKMTMEWKYHCDICGWYFFHECARTQHYVRKRCKYYSNIYSIS